MGGHVTAHRVALVTGGARGIGRAIADALGTEGASVALNDIDEPALDAAVAELTARGVRAVGVAGDITAAGTAERLVGSVVQALGAVDVLVNNAGLGSGGRPIATVDLDEVSRLFAVNVVGPLALCRAVIPSMRAKGRGHIIVISSMVLRDWPAGGAPYNIAKAALEAMAHTLAAEETGHGIRVNIVRPGLMDTRLTTEVLTRLAEVPAAVRSQPSLRLFGSPVRQPHEVARVVQFLASDRAPYINDQIIEVGG